MTELKLEVGKWYEDENCNFWKIKQKKTEKHNVIFYIKHMLDQKFLLIEDL